MSHGIKKETYVNADEKTTKALTFDLLDNVYKKVDRLEKRKRRDTAISASSGAAGGFVAMIILQVRRWYLD